MEIYSLIRSFTNYIVKVKKQSVLFFYNTDCKMIIKYLYLLNSYIFTHNKNFYIRFITLQGFPTATLLGGMLLFTMLPAPITTLSPIVTPGSTTTFPPIHTLLPTFIGFAYSNPSFLCL